MNNHTEEQLTRFMGIMKALQIPKEQIFGICSMLKSEEMMIEILDRLEEKEFKTTPQETMNICGEVIKKYQ